MKYRVTDIEWDVDDPEFPGQTALELGLPDAMTVELEDGLDDDEAEEFISDEITDTYGFCHNGFKYEKIEKIEKIENEGDTK